MSGQSQEPKDSISMETACVMWHVKGEENHKKDREKKQKKTHPKQNTFDNLVFNWGWMQHRIKM